MAVYYSECKMYTVGVWVWVSIGVSVSWYLSEEVTYYMYLSQVSLESSGMQHWSINDVQLWLDMAR